MNIHCAAHYLQLGYRIRRKKWIEHKYVQLKKDLVKFNIEELMADDWEIITHGIKSYFPIKYFKIKL